MVNINYKSDFSFYLTLRDSNGQEIGVPDFPWEAVFYTYSRANTFVASYDGRNKIGWVEDNGKILIVCNSHGLPTGKLRVEFTSHLPDDLYPDKEDKQVLPQPLDITLVRCASDRPQCIDVEVMLPYIKGDPFTFEDFTQEQLDELKKPAEDAATDAERRTTEAISGMQTAVQTAINEMNARSAEIDEAEELRVTAEKNRVTAETERTNAETERQEAEALRVNAEALRVNAETSRISAEDGRVASEQARVDAENNRKAEEQKRADAESQREANETERAEQSLYGSYTIDFGETSRQAVDLNLCGGDIEITAIQPFNIASVTVANGDIVIEFVPDSFSPFTVKEGASAVWQIERGAEGQNAAIGIRYKVIK